MTELSVGSIIEKLKEHFKTNYYVTWYDDNAFFKENINEIIEQLVDVKLLIVKKGEVFKNKVYFHEHMEEKFLIYFPYSKPKDDDNLFLDVELYAKNYTADAEDMLRDELGLSHNKLLFVKEHLNFFNSKERKFDFIRFYSEKKDIEPELGIIAAIEKFTNLTKENRIQLLTPVLIGGVENNKYIESFKKYGVNSNFWQLMSEEFGYENVKEPSLKELIYSLFITYAFDKVPEELKRYQLNINSLANVKSYMSNFEDSSINREVFKKYGNQIWDELKIERILKNLSISTIMDIKAFYNIDNLLLDWVKNKIINGEFSALAGKNKNIVELIEDRLTVNNLRNNKSIILQYKMLKYAYKLLNYSIRSQVDIEKIIDAYVEFDYKVDLYYRKFIFYYRSLLIEREIERVEYNDLKEYIDNIYTNEFLNKSIVTFNKFYNPNETFGKKQSDFYRNYVGIQKDRIVVIISDALRYEIAKELQSKLEENRRINTKMDYAITGIPSVTYMGMSVLLPHDELEFDLENKKVLVDGKNADNLQRRSQILADNRSDGQAIAYSFNEVLNASSKERKEMFSHKKVVYIYHNDVDAKGDQLKTELETFQSAQHAINDIASVVEKLRTISVSHIIITADHGFIYRDEKLNELDKIEVDNSKVQKSPRYVLSENELGEIPGVKSVKIGVSLNNDDKINVYYPSTVNVFKSSGTTSYVHGGASLQELIVPILDIKLSSNSKETIPVNVKLVPTGSTITSYDFSAKFNQEQAVSDVYSACDYKIYLVDDEENKISNEKTVRFDSKEQDIRDRAQFVTLQLRKIEYDIAKTYRLIIEQLGSENNRTEYKFNINLI